MAAVGGNTGNQATRHSTVSDSNYRAREKDDTGRSRSSRVRVDEGSHKKTVGLEVGQGGHRENKVVDKTQVSTRAVQKSGHVDHKRESPPGKTESQPARTEVSEELLAGKVDFPWEFNDRDKKVFQTAAAIRNYRMSLGPKSHNTYITNVSANISDKKLISGKSAEFAEMVGLHAMNLPVMGNEEPENFMLSEDGIKAEIEGMNKKYDRVNFIIGRLARAKSKAELTKCYQGKSLADSDRCNVLAEVCDEAVSRYSIKSMAYLQRKRDEALGDDTNLTVFAEKGSERTGVCIPYISTGVKMLDRGYCHPSIPKYLDAFFKGIKFKHADEWIKKKDSSLPITVESIKDLCADLSVVAEKHLTQPRYDEKTNDFIEPTPREKDLEGACRRFLRDGSHKLSDSAIIGLIPCYQKHYQKNYIRRCLERSPETYKGKTIPVKNDYIDSLLTDVLGVALRRGTEAALERWDEIATRQPHDIVLMRRRVVENSMPPFMEVKKGFSEELKMNQMGQKNTEVAVAALKKSGIKKGKDGERMRAVIRAAERRAAREERDNKAKDEEYYKGRMQTGGGASESRPEDQNLALAVYDSGGRSRFMESFKAQSEKKPELKSKGSPNDIGIKSLDERLMTRDLVRGLREFVNVFADFQPAAKKK